MSQEQKQYGTPPVATPITINACGQSNPPSASISISNNGGAKFNAAYACTLNFDATNGCPFSTCSGNSLSLSQGDNNVSLKNPVTQQTYSYSVNPPKKPGENCPNAPADDPFDVVVGS